jgi:hypothetical protein
VGQRVPAAPVRGRREGPIRCRHYLPLQRGRLHRVSCVVVRCPRRVMAVRVPWTQVQHSVGRVRAGARRARLCCVRGDARRRNLLDLKVRSLTLPPVGLPSAPALSSIYRSSRCSVLSSYGYTCDIFPLKSINTTFVSIDTWSTSYTSGLSLPTYSYFLSIYELRMAILYGHCNMTGRIYRTYSSVFVASPSRIPSSPSLSRARCRSSNWVISRFYFPWLLPWCYFRCLVLSLFPSFPPFFFLLFQSLVYSVYIGTMV